jgi:hypothetical protein
MGAALINSPTGKTVACLYISLDRVIREERKRERDTERERARKRGSDLRVERKVPGIVDHERCTSVPSSNSCQDSDPSSGLGCIRNVSAKEVRVCRKRENSERKRGGETYPNAPIVKRMNASSKRAKTMKTAMVVLQDATSMYNWRGKKVRNFSLSFLLFFFFLILTVKIVQASKNNPVATCALLGSRLGASYFTYQAKDIQKAP